MRAGSVARPAPSVPVTVRYSADTEPDRFDAEREDRHHIAFGGGRHFCLGAHLAQVEAQEAFRALLARLSTLRLAEAGYRRASVPSFRGFETLCVEAGD